MFMRIAVPLLLFLAPRLLPQVIRFGRLVWRLSLDKRVPLVLRLLLPVAILYALSPIDLVRDTVPILGRFDDLIFIAFALLLLVKLSPREACGRAQRRSSAVQPPRRHRPGQGSRRHRGAS